MRVGDVRRIVAATGIDLTGDPVALCEDLDMAEFQFATYKAWHKRKRKLPLNATEWLVGARLPELFEKYFNRHAGRSRNADNSLRSNPLHQVYPSLRRRYGPRGKALFCRDDCPQYDQGKPSLGKFSEIIFIPYDEAN
jgi:hypothetical protein